MDKPQVFMCEDGSISLEWIHKDARMMISLENELGVSSWNVVSKRDGLWSRDGFLKDITIKKIYDMYLKELEFAKNNKEDNKI